MKTVVTWCWTMIHFPRRPKINNADKRCFKERSISTHKKNRNQFSNKSLLFSFEQHTYFVPLAILRERESVWGSLKELVVIYEHYNKWRNNFVHSRNCTFFLLFCTSTILTSIYEPTSTSIDRPKNKFFQLQSSGTTTQKVCILVGKEIASERTQE